MLWFVKSIKVSGIFGMSRYVVVFVCLLTEQFAKLTQSRLMVQVLVSDDIGKGMLATPPLGCLS